MRYPITKSAFDRLCRARDMLQEPHDDRLSIEDVARTAGVSPFHFIRRFRALFGETPHQFRMRARLDRAKHLLAVSDYSVTDVCMEVGLTSLGSFSDLFARRVGVSPSVYRRRIRSIRWPRAVALEPAPGCLTLMGAAFAISEKQSPVHLSDSSATSAALEDS